MAAAIKRPELALPAAFLSHFVIDAIPHYDHKDLLPNRTLYKLVISLDIIFSVVLLLILATALNRPAWLIISGGVLGILPDTMWLPAIITGKRAKMDQKNLLHFLRRFHAKIQWSESPKGAFVEAAWFLIMGLIILNLR